MSQAFTASRGSASRIVRRSASSGSPRRSAMRSLTAATRAEPSSRGGPGSRSARAARTALASPTRPSASYVAPIRARVGVDVDQPPGEAQRVLAGRLGAELGADGEQDVGVRRAAPASPARRAPSRRASGSSSGKAPLPMYVVATGAPSRSATRAKLVPGARSGGRRPRPRRRVARPRRAGRPPRRGSVAVGAGELPGVGVELLRRARRCPPARTSTGISTKTGPLGARQRPPPGLREQVRDLLGRLGASRPLHDRLEGGLLVGELVQEAAAGADQVARDLARDRDDGDVRARRLHERRERDERARAGGEEERRRAAARSRVAVGGEPGRELRAQPDGADRARPQAVPDRERVDARDAERDLGAERLEALCDQACRPYAL